MDKILMENMRFYGYHGVMAEEKALGQKFIVDAVLYLPLQKAGQSDNLKDTVDYGAVYKRIGDIVEKEQYHLIEALAERICGEVFAMSFSIAKIVIRIKKPEAPIPGIFDFVGVELERERP